MTQSTENAKVVNLDDAYMTMAISMSQLSKANRKKVGAVLVTKHGVVLTGYNGTASGDTNDCEDEDGNTKREVLHAELNCILKAAREGVSVVGGSLYVTLSPCLQCAAMIAQSGIKQVYFQELYRCSKGIDLLIKLGVGIYVHSHDAELINMLKSVGNPNNLCNKMREYQNGKEK